MIVHPCFVVGILCALPLTIPPPQVNSNPELVKRFVEEVWNDRNLDAIDELLAANFIRIGPTREFSAYGRDEFKQYVKEVHTAYPDFRIELDGIEEIDDAVLTRWTVRGTNTGDARHPATGKAVELAGTALLRCADGKIQSERASWDVLELYRQLGVVGTATDAREQNLTAARRLLEEVYGEGRLDAAPTFVETGHRFHVPASEGSTDGLQGLKARVNMFRTAFPDLKFDIQEMITDGDVVAIRWTFRGTHKGEFLGVAPTGKHVEVPGLSMSRVKDGKISESWGVWDTQDVLRQLGAGAQKEPK